MSAPGSAELSLLVVIDPVARRTDGESVRIARDVLSAGAATKICLPDDGEEFARALSRRGRRRPVVIGDDRALLRAVGQLYRERELGRVSLAVVPVGPPETVALSRSLGLPTDAVAAARTVLDGAVRDLDLLTDDSDGVVVASLRIAEPPQAPAEAAGRARAQTPAEAAGRARTRPAVAPGTDAPAKGPVTASREASQEAPQEAPREAREIPGKASGASPVRAVASAAAEGGSAAAGPRAVAAGVPRQTTPPDVPGPAAAPGGPGRAATPGVPRQEVPAGAGRLVPHAVTPVTSGAVAEGVPSGTTGPSASSLQAASAEPAVGAAGPVSESAGLTTESAGLTTEAAGPATSAVVAEDGSPEADAGAVTGLGAESGAGEDTQVGAAGSSADRTGLHAGSPGGALGGGPGGGGGEGPVAGRGDGRAELAATGADGVTGAAAGPSSGTTHAAARTMLALLAAPVTGLGSLAGSVVPGSVRRRRTALPEASRLRVEADGVVVADLDQPLRGVSVVPAGHGTTSADPAEGDAADGTAEVVIHLPSSERPLRVRAHAVTVSGPDFHYRADTELGGPVRTRTWTVRPRAWRLVLPRN
ncbi:hypothetical protein ACFV3R_29200 [Streptomyces sp. NPDC059740]|uniref:hypothetical protein n=1 Tax=Streptomyces sp. NPDC059740 TaxID=3346926 RepID=UPI00364E6866